MSAQVEDRHFDQQESMPRRSPRLRSRGHYNPKEESKPVSVTNITETETTFRNSTGTDEWTSAVNENDIPLLFVTEVDILLRSWKEISRGLILILMPFILWVLLPFVASALSTVPYKYVSIKEEQHVLTVSDADLDNLHLEPILMLEKLQQHFPDLNAGFADLSLRIQELEAKNAKLAALISSPAQLLTPELLQFMEKWFSDRLKEQDAAWLVDNACQSPMADKMADFTLASLGGRVISTRYSKTYHSRSTCLYLLGIPLWCRSPETVIQSAPVLPGKCWPFHGDQVGLVISLSHPVRITHVTLDHLARYNSPTGHINDAPKDFKVDGMKTKSEEGTLLGTFTYNQNGVPTQTFRIPNPSDEVYQFVELHVLSNWGNMEYTCLYRFRVHGKISN